MDDESLFLKESVVYRDFIINVFVYLFFGLEMFSSSRVKCSLESKLYRSENVFLQENGAL